MSNHITTKEADDPLEHSQPYPLADGFYLGQSAGHAHLVGVIRNAYGGRWVLTAGHTTNMVSTREFGEIVFTEDEEIVGLRFRDTKGDSEFEVNLFIAKAGGLDCESLPLVQRMIQ